MGFFDDLKAGYEKVKNTRWQTTADEEKNPTPPPKKAKTVKPVPAEPEDDMPATGPDGKYLKPRPYKKGGKVSSASSRADGCAQRGKTRGKYL